MTIKIGSGCRRAAAMVLGMAIAGIVHAQSTPALTHRDIHVQILQARGHDMRVDYTGLTKFGPWDDRNYNLTAEDLAVLSPHEDDVKQPLPAFYRVEMRKANPNLPKSGPGQYPRSALNGFLAKYHGYQISGAEYRELRTLGGNRYEVTVSAPASTQVANFLGGEKRITTPAGAAESAVAVNPANTNLVIAGTNGPGNGQKMWRSSDGGVTWSGPVSLAGTCCDPSVGWSPDGSVAYAMALSSVVGSGTNVFFYRSTDNGASWNQTATLSNQHQSDKEYFTVDTYASSPRKGNIYTAWHDNNVQKFARSTDGGVTFGAVLTLDSANRGIGSDLSTDKNGNAYFFYPTTTGGTVDHQVRVLKSTDGGATFAAGVNVAALNADYDFPIPAMETRRAFIYVSAGTDFSSGPFANSLYVAWTDTSAAEDNDVATNNHAVVHVARSRDGGATWAVSTPHPTSDVNTVDRFNHWLSVDNQGRVFVMYYDTRNSAGRSGTDIYYAVSTDGAVTWSTPTRLTTATSKNITDTFEWGDYNGMDMQMANIMAIYTDNRDETGGSAESIDVYGIGGFAPSTGNVAPTANYSFSTSGLTATFTDSSTDDGTITSRSWNFGDGTAASTATNPTHTYAASGTYNVTLTVTDNGGLTGAITKPVTAAIDAPPVANFTFTTSNLTASFTDTSSDVSGTITTRSWNFGDGQTSTATNPSHTYAAAGTYSVALTVTDNHGSNASTTKSVTVSSTNTAPTANFTSSVSGLVATFTDTSTDPQGNATITSRAWSFGDGGTSTATSPSHTYAAAGTYTVQLTVTDNGGLSNSKTATVSTNACGGSQLCNGVAVTGLSGAAGATLNYTMAVPAGATALKFVIAGGTGDADLYVKFGSAPTTGSYDCRPYQSGNSESCPIATAQAGTYYVMVRGFAAFSGVALTGSYTIGAPPGPSFTNNTAMAINDNTTINSTIAVTGVTGAASATLKVPVNITHTYQGDLKIDLIAPNGTTFNLWNRTGAGTDNINQTFTVNASSVTAPNGTWTLRVADQAAGDTGTLNSWGLQF